VLFHRPGKMVSWRLQNSPAMIASSAAIPAAIAAAPGARSNVRRTCVW
jgi:hypothetical protein